MYLIQVSNKADNIADNIKNDNFLNMQQNILQ